MPFRIIKKARSGKEARARERRTKRKEEKKKERNTETAEERRKKRAPGATSSSSSSTFYRFVKVRKRVLTPHARETRTQARTYERTHALTPPKEAESPRRAKDLDFFLLVDFFSPFPSLDLASRAKSHRSNARR